MHAWSFPTLHEKEKEIHIVPSKIRDIETGKVGAHYWTGDLQPNDVTDVPVWKLVMIDLMEEYDARTAAARHARVRTMFQVMKKKCFLSVRKEGTINDGCSG